MRFWKDSHGNIITDEQLVRHIANKGSLSDALAYGDIKLISGSPSEPLPERPTTTGRREHAKLASFL